MTMQLAGVTLTQAVDTDSAELIELFRNNYKDGYYNKNFATKESLAALISQDDFVGLTARYNGKVVGFSGIYMSKKTQYNEVYLAHFLVDQAHQGLGVGKLIDQKKLEFCDYLEPRSIVLSILGEGSPACVQIKKKYQYSLWGVRLFYGEWEPNQNGDGHLLVVGRVVKFAATIKALPNLHALTQKLIRSTDTMVSFDLSVAGENRFWVEYPDEVQFGQYACLVRTCAAGISLQEIIARVTQNKDNPYIVIRVNVEGFSRTLENILLESGFFPTSFLPYFDNGLDVIEYQYIRPDKIERLSNNLANKDLILAYLKAKATY